MKIEKVHIRNFRKLKDCQIEFEEKQTIFVGANNSGKTTAMNALRWFLSENTFSMQDFTATSWKDINEIGKLWGTKSADLNDLSVDKWFAILPSMDVWLYIPKNEIYYVYDLLPSLDWEGNYVGARLCYQPSDIKKLYSDFIEAINKVKDIKSVHGEDINLYPQNLLDFLSHGNNLSKYFKIVAYLLDEAKDYDGDIIDNHYELSQNPFKGLIKIDFIEALREFTEAEGKNQTEIDTLSKQLQNYYNNHLDPSENIQEDNYDLIKVIEQTNDVFDSTLKKAFESPIEELQKVNYPGFHSPKLEIHSYANPHDSITHESAVQFAIPTETEQSDLKLSEKYNGLGYRNLISMYFRIMQFRDNWLHVKKHQQEEYKIEPIHLIMIEEPEAHLHAQAQQVFIREVYNGLTNCDYLKKNPWLTTQLIVSTHSTHIVEEVELKDMRYFKRIIKGGIPVSEVVNMSGTFASDEQENEKFVARYLRLMHYDIFFADAVVLVEGAAERILMPKFLQKEKLLNNYISVVEINGSHAFRFKPLIEKLGITTLVVSDIDAQDANQKACLTKKNANQKTNNDTIKKWIIKKESIDDLLSLNFEEKVKENVCVVYQMGIDIKENDVTSTLYPYTFEDAFAITNIDIFRNGNYAKMGSLTTVNNIFKNGKTISDSVCKLFKKLDSGQFKKAEFATWILFSDICEIMETPNYIKEGLNWLKCHIINAKH